MSDNVEKIIKIVGAMMLMEGIMITKEDKENIRECLANGDVDDKIKEIIEIYENKK